MSLYSGNRYKNSRNEALFCSVTAILLYLAHYCGLNSSLYSLVNDAISLTEVNMSLPATSLACLTTTEAKALL